MRRYVSKYVVLYSAGHLDCNHKIKRLFFCHFTMKNNNYERLVLMGFRNWKYWNRENVWIQTKDSSRLFIVTSMPYSWIIHVSFVPLPWIIHASYMTYSWLTPQSSMTSPWPIQYWLMSHPWIIHKSSMTDPWLTHESSMPHPWIKPDLFVSHPDLTLKTMKHTFRFLVRAT